MEESYLSGGVYETGIFWNEGEPVECPFCHETGWVSACFSSKGDERTRKYAGHICCKCQKSFRMRVKTLVSEDRVIW